MNENKKMKKLTVVMWDSDYRDSFILKDTIQCLKSQTVLDHLEIIFIEWTAKKKPEILDCDFINLFNIDSEECLDTGVQWNLGLYLAKTDWVAYHHCDIIPADHYEKIIKRINKIEENNDITIYFEGWNVNLIGHTGSKFRAEYEEYKKKLGNNLCQLPDLYIKETSRAAQPGGGAFTVQKNKFIQEVDGWCWNRRTKLWCGPGWSQPNLPKNQSVRKFLMSTKKATVGCSEIYVYLTPHARPGGYIPTHIIDNNTKYYSDFIDEWLPAHPSLDGNREN
jgi:glycosyltransferase involved in cell wall biosynthesis